jgi:hypothetical protein
MVVAKQVLVQKFITETSSKALNEAVLYRRVVWIRQPNPWFDKNLELRLTYVVKN